MAKKMTKKDNSIKTFSGQRVPQKKMKLYLAMAKTAEEKRAIKNFVLGEDVKFFGKNTDTDGEAVEAVEA